MKANLTYCTKCKYIKINVLDLLASVHCSFAYESKKAASSYMALILRDRPINSNHETKSCLMESFTSELHQTQCPYVLEHTLSTDEEKNQTLDSLQSLFKNKVN